MADDQEDLEARIQQTEERIEQAEADADRSRERLERLKRERRANAGPDLEEFKDMTPSERRDLRERSPERWRDLMERRQQEGHAALQSTSPGRLGA